MSSPRIAHLVRFGPMGPNNPTTGVLYVTDEAGQVIGSTCTLELPWKGNARGASCIPAGTYPLKWTYSPRFKRSMLLVMGVPGRDGIRIHAANFVHQLAGCIAPVSYHSHLNADGAIDGASSAPATDRLESLLPQGATYAIRITEAATYAAP